MQVFTTVPLTELARAGELFAELEDVGYDGAFTYETDHDPFLPLALAATTTSRLRLGTSIAIAFARTPMLLANVGWDLQDVSRGRFTLGLGSQIRPHIEQRYSMPWSRPAARMHELVRAIHAIWDHWDGVADLDFRGEFFTHTLMTPVFVPGPHRYGRAPIHVAGVGPAMTRVAGEVADGFIAHPFNTAASLRQLSWPALDAGLDGGGALARRRRTRGGVPGRDRGRRRRARRRDRHRPARSSPSTPPRPPTRGCSRSTGGRACNPRSTPCRSRGAGTTWRTWSPTRCSRPSRWWGGATRSPAWSRAKLDGQADVVSLECTRRPDPTHFADVVAGLKGVPA